MKTTVKLFALMLILLGTSVHSQAYSFVQDGIYYNILSGTDNTVEVTYLDYYTDDYEGDIVIPSEVSFYSSTTYTVTAIGDHAFSACSNLNSITLPETLTTIEMYAFVGCSNLTTIDIPEGVTSIGEGAFRYCTSLYSINLPESATTIGNGAFFGCSNLNSIALPDGITNIGDEMFNESGLTSITLPNSLISIGNNAFYMCSRLSSIIIPNSVTDIGIKAFSNCSSLSSITLSNNITVIKEGTFGYCPLSSITLPPSITTIESSAFTYCGLTFINIPDNVKSIANTAFSGCYKLENINVDTNNSSYASIDGVLYDKDITSLLKCPAAKTSVLIPNSVNTIVESAFFYCSHLSSITIPNSVTAIGRSAFYGCNALKSIQMLCETPIECNPGFDNTVYKNATLYVPAGTRSAYESTAPWSNFSKIEETIITGIDGIEADNGLQLSVNNGTLTISGINDHEIVAIYDIQGRTIYCGPGRTIENLATGLYIVKIGDRTAKILI